MELPTSAPPPPDPPPNPTIITPPPPAPANSPARSAVGWLIAAGITVLVIVLGLWAFLGGMPFGKSQPSVAANGQPLDTIGEGSATGTLSQIGDAAPLTPVPPPATGDTTGTFATTTTSMPIDAGTAAPSTPVAPPTATYAAPPPPRPIPRPVPQPVPVLQPAPIPQPTPPASDELLDESGATVRLRSFLAQNNPYDVPIRCLDISSLGFSNRGYTLQVTQLACDSAEARTLDRWRVDALTREVFRQRSDGRFTRP